MPDSVPLRSIPGAFPNADNIPSHEKVKDLHSAWRSPSPSAWPSFPADFFQPFSAVLPQLFPHFLVAGTSVLLTLLPTATETEDRMARYSAFLGRRVEVQYRAGDILLPASGTFVADSGRSIFLEQNFEQRGQHKHFRWEIPYQCLVRIEEKPDAGVSANAGTAPAKPENAPEAPAASKSTADPLSAAASAGGAPGILPLNRPKTA